MKDRLDGLLAGNEAKPARERLTLMRIFEELRGLGYEGGYDAVRRCARAWRREWPSLTTAGFVPLSFAPGGVSVRLEPRDRAEEQKRFCMQGQDERPAPTGRLHPGQPLWAPRVPPRQADRIPLGYRSVERLFRSGPVPLVRPSPAISAIVRPFWCCGT